MSVRRLGVLQWVGLLAGGAVWSSQHILGLGITQAECGIGGAHWGIANDRWEGALLAVAAVFVAGAEAAALTVLVSTRDTSYEDEPPLSRIRFFAIAAAIANLLFLTAMLLDGFASIFDTACRQA